MTMLLWSIVFGAIFIFLATREMESRTNKAPETLTQATVFWRSSRAWFVHRSMTDQISKLTVERDAWKADRNSLKEAWWKQREATGNIAYSEYERGYKDGLAKTYNHGQTVEEKPNDGA